MKAVRSQPLALAFWKLNLAAIHERGNGCITIFSASQDCKKVGGLLVVAFSPVKWSKCLGCHMVVKQGTHIDVNLRNFAMLYSAVAVVMMKIVLRPV